MLNLRSYKDIEKITNKLLELVIKEYDYHPADELYVNIDKIEITYIDEKPTTTIYIKFGRLVGVKHKDNWEHAIDLILIDDNLDFIAGQFFQAMMERNL